MNIRDSNRRKTSTGKKKQSLLQSCYRCKRKKKQKKKTNSITRWEKYAGDDNREHLKLRKDIVLGIQTCTLDE